MSAFLSEWSARDRREAFEALQLLELSFRPALDPTRDERAAEKAGQTVNGRRLILAVPVKDVSVHSTLYRSVSV